MSNISSPLVVQITSRKCRWTGHRQIAEKQHRKTGFDTESSRDAEKRPKNIWRRDTMKVLKAEVLAWSDLENKANNWNDWKASVCGLCLKEGLQVRTYKMSNISNLLLSIMVNEWWAFETNSFIQHKWWLTSNLITFSKRKKKRKNFKGQVLTELYNYSRYVVPSPYPRWETHLLFFLFIIVFIFEQFFSPKLEDGTEFLLAERCGCAV